MVKAHKTLTKEYNTMNKITRWGAAMAIVAILLPVSVSLADDNIKAKSWVGAEFRGLLNLSHRDRAEVKVSENGEKHRALFKSGSVTAISSNGFTLLAEDGTSYTVDTSNAKLLRLSADGKAMVALTDLKITDKVVVRGERADDGTLNARMVYAIPANTHPASGRGTVTAVSGNNFTLQLNNHGIISNVTVDTSANTVIKQDGKASASMADIQVGSKVKVRGLWDEVLNVLNAIRIKIF